MTTHPTYPSTCDSCLPWLGQIPAHWEAKRLKRIFFVTNGSTPSSGVPEYWDGDIVWVTPEDLGKLESDTLYESGRRITKNGYQNCGTTLAPKGSLILSTRAPIGHLAIAGVEYCTNQGCRSLVFRSENEVRYFYYLILSARTELQSRGTGTTFAELGKSKLETIELPLPPLPEQRTIAAFLDRQTAKIDTLIAKKQRLLDLLAEQRSALISQAVTKGLNPAAKMKDSGVVWLGQVPIHWAVSRVKFGYDIRLGKMLRPEALSHTDTLESYLRAANVQWENVDTNDVKEMWFSSWEKSLYALQPGDLVVCEGGDVGRAAIWDGSIQNCYIQNSIHRVRAKAGFVDKFLYYWLYTLKDKGYIDLLCNKATIAHFTAEKFADIELIVPPYKEQTDIVSYLECETKKLDGLVITVQTAKERLREYRSALISSAVTGKICIKAEG